jgi:hypothetical protein
MNIWVHHPPWRVRSRNIIVFDLELNDTNENPEDKPGIVSTFKHFIKYWAWEFQFWLIELQKIAFGSY